MAAISVRSLHQDKNTRYSANRSQIEAASTVKLGGWAGVIHQSHPVPTIEWSGGMKVRECGGCDSKGVTLTDWLAWKLTAKEGLAANGVSARLDIGHLEGTSDSG